MIGLQNSGYADRDVIQTETQWTSHTLQTQLSAVSLARAFDLAPMTTAWTPHPFAVIANGGNRKCCAKRDDDVPQQNSKAHAASSPHLQKTQDWGTLSNVVALLRFGCDLVFSTPKD
jgi:hypothetical protein